MNLNYSNTELKTMWSQNTLEPPSQNAFQKCPPSTRLTHNHTISSTFYSHCSAHFTNDNTSSFLVTLFSFLLLL